MSDKNTHKSPRVAKFHKVRFEQFLASAKNLKGYETLDDAQIKELYDAIELPTRGTSGSAGYDFFAPNDFTLAPGETILIPTGISAEMREDYALMIYPRSGLGFKFRMQLDNTTGVIDSDYFYSDNEGHIMAKITNDTRDNKSIEILQGQGFMQGIFTSYGITIDDDITSTRNGGFGSTDAK